MWDSNPRVFLHHDLDQELLLVAEPFGSRPQRGAVTTWLILLLGFDRLLGYSISDLLLGCCEEP